VGDIKEPNELVKIIPLHLKFLRKIHICAFAGLIFWQFSEKIQRLVPRIPFTLSDPEFCASPTTGKLKTGYSEKKPDRVVLGEKEV